MSPVLDICRKSVKTDRQFRSSSAIVRLGMWTKSVTWALVSPPMRIGKLDAIPLTGESAKLSPSPHSRQKVQGEFSCAIEHLSCRVWFSY